eukprot:8414248-Alexandrium_andersonii.AAC.1
MGVIVDPERPAVLPLVGAGRRLAGRGAAAPHQPADRRAEPRHRLGDPADVQELALGGDAVDLRERLLAEHHRLVAELDLLAGPQPGVIVHHHPCRALGGLSPASHPAR